MRSRLKQSQLRQKLEMAMNFTTALAMLSTGADCDNSAYYSRHISDGKQCGRLGKQRWNGRVPTAASQWSGSDLCGGRKSQLRDAALWSPPCPQVLWSPSSSWCYHRKPHSHFMGIRHTTQPAATLPVKPSNAPSQPTRCRHLGSRWCHYSRQPLYLWFREPPLVGRAAGCRRKCRDFTAMLLGFTCMTRRKSTFCHRLTATA